MRIAAVFGLALMMAVPPCALAQKAIRQYRTTIQLDIDAHGMVDRVGMPEPLPEVLVAPVRQTVADWRFKPPEIDGHPVSARTWAYVTVQVVKRPNHGYGVRVVYRDNGPKITYRYPPAYPLRARKLHYEASLLISATIEPDGSLDDVHLVDKRGKGVPIFLRAVRRAFEHWHASPMLVNGKPAATHVQVPITFERNMFGGGDRRNVKPGFPLPPWMKGVSGEPFATDSPLQRLQDSDLPVDTARSSAG